MAKTNYSPTFPMFPGGAKTVTPSDNFNLPFVGVVYVGSAGNVKVTTAQGDEVTFNNVPNGAVLPLQVQKVWATGTSATSMLLIY